MSKRSDSISDIGNAIQIKKLKTVLKRVNVTQAELAKQLGLHTSTIATWGEKRNSTYDKYIPQIAQILGVTEDTLRNPDPMVFKRVDPENYEILPKDAYIGAMVRAAVQMEDEQLNTLNIVMREMLLNKEHPFDHDNDE